MLPYYVYYHEGLNRIFTFNHATSILESLDHDYNSLGGVSSIPGGNITFKQNASSATIMAFDGSSVDFINLTFLFKTSTNLNIPNISNLYAQVQHDRTSDGNLYISWVTLGTWNMNFQKVDPVTGDLLNRIVSNDDTIDFNNFEEVKELSVFPNPFDDSLKIQKEDTGQISQVLIYNRFGSIVREHKAKGFDTMINIDTSTLPRGIYFVKTVLSDGTSETKQVIKE